MSIDTPQRIVIYRCRACDRALQMGTTPPGDYLPFINRAWCSPCQRYVTKSEASAESRLKDAP